ncbi:DNA polymerase I [Candidatus Falkowbacteria bacterium]|nr:DNA polymerase I [Candidatus Falkowbacteria bacterium]
MSKNKKKLIIIDGNALIHRSFHAIPPTLRTKGGLLVNAVYGFSSFLLKALSEFKPDYVVLTLDKKGPTFRHEAYSEYKATRVKAPDELYEQIPLIKRLAQAFDIPVFELSGFEADDLIGTICNLKENSSLEKIIITGDLDTLQLVNENTKVYTMSRGLSDSILYDEDKIKERYGFGADKIIDYKALRGDPSDNIPGVKGVGEKSATELLLKFENLEGIYQALEKKESGLKERTIELLETDKDKAFMSRELATINLSAPIKFNLEATRFNTFKTEEVFELFSEFEFRSLLVKVKTLKDLLTNKGGDSNLIEGTEKNVKNNNSFKGNKKATLNKIVKTKTELLDLIKMIEREKIFSLKIASTIIGEKQTIQGLSLTIKETKSFFIKTENLNELKKILEDEKIKKIGHDLKNEYLLCKTLGINLSGLYFDTMLASYLLNPNTRNHEISSLAFKELGLDEKIETKSEQKSTQLSLELDGPDIQKISEQAGRETDIIFRLKKVLNVRLEEENLLEVFNKIELPLIEVLGEMESAGVLFDEKPIKALGKKLDLKIKKLEQEIHQLAGENFNINSTKQLKEILFEKLKISSVGIKKGKNGFSTADDELEKLLEAHPIISKLRDYRETNKLITTYINPLPELVDKKTGRIHSHFNQAIAATGRLSSTDPNLQNIPARTEEGKIIRQAFIVAKDYLMLSLDYSQIELRLAAHLSGDKKMLSAFLNQEDIHRATAALINDVKLDEVTKKMRQEAKATNFGIIYGQGPHGLAQAANIPYYQAKDFIAKYFASYPGIKKAMDKSITEAQKKGFTITISGRKRPLPEINSSIPMIKKAAERIAINAPIQGGAADIIKMAMINIYDLIKNDSENIRLLLQVHDELIFEVKQTKLDYYLPKIKNLMTEVLKLKVPLEVEGGAAENWGDLK